MLFKKGEFGRGRIQCTKPGAFRTLFCPRCVSVSLIAFIILTHYFSRENTRQQQRKFSHVCKNMRCNNTREIFKHWSKKRIFINTVLCNFVSSFILIPQKVRILKDESISRNFFDIFHFSIKIKTTFRKCKISPKNSVKLIHFTSFFGLTFFNFLAYCVSPPSLFVLISRKNI